MGEWRKDGGLENMYLFAYFLMFESFLGRDKVVF